MGMAGTTYKLQNKVCIPFSLHQPKCTHPIIVGLQHYLVLLRFTFFHPLLSAFLAIQIRTHHLHPRCEPPASVRFPICVVIFSKAHYRASTQSEVSIFGCLTNAERTNNVHTTFLARIFRAFTLYTAESSIRFPSFVLLKTSSADEITADGQSV